MPDVIATVGSATANSFATEDEFADYLDTRLNVGTYTTTEKARALIEATREISLFEFLGRRASSTQALSFPRELCPIPDDPNNDYHSTTEIPQRIIDAVCEYAYQFLLAGTTDPSALDSSIGIKSESVGPVAVTYAEPYQRAQGIQRYPRVLKMIAPYLVSRPGGQARVVRG